MDCEQALNLISARMDGEITAPDRKELDAHLEVCPACREAVETWRRQDADLRRVFHPLQQKALSVSAYVESRLLGMRVVDTRRRLKWLRAIVSAAAGFLLAVVIFQPWRTPESAPTVARPASTEGTRLEIATGTVEVLAPGSDAW